MEIRPATPADPVREVIRAAFADEGEEVADVWAAVVACGLHRASLVAVEGTAVVGHVGLSHGWLDTRRALVDVLVLSPLSVAPDRQGSGIGTALLAAALAAAEDTAAPAVFLEGDPGFYARRGFVAGAVKGFEAPSRRIPGAAFQVATLSAHEPWMTGRLVYRDVWWEHDCVGLRDPMLAEVEASLDGAEDPGGLT